MPAGGLLRPALAWSPWRPTVGAVTRHLIRHASIRPGEPFRGYTVTYFGDPSGHLRHAVDYRAPNMSWDVYVRARQYLAGHYRNRFQEMDLWEFGIPTFEEYGQWVTRQIHAFARDAFSDPGDAGHPVVLRVYRLDLDLLPLLGVRYVITDAPLHDPRLALRAQDRAPTAGPISLYEIREPNLGGYSPTRPLRRQTMAETVETLRERRSSLRTDVVVFEDLASPFVPARHATMRMERDGLSVSATSDGTSLLLLPVQFSRCFLLQPGPGGHRGASARLLRANGIQTLLMFSGRVDALIRLEFGLLGGARCRLEDGDDFDTLRVDEAGTAARRTPS